MSGSNPAADTLRLMRELFDLNQVLLDLEREEQPGTVVDLMALVIHETVGYASHIAPWWTGTLALSHRGEVENLPGQVVGYVYLDPSAVNPVSGGRPVDYGPVAHESQPWMDWTVEWLLDEILVDLDDKIIAALADHIAQRAGAGAERIFAL